MVTPASTPSCCPWSINSPNNTFDNIPPDIQALNLKGATFLTDEELIEITARCTAICEVVLDNCIQITYHGVFTAAQNLPKVKRLSIHNCNLNVVDVADLQKRFQQIKFDYLDAHS